MAKIITTKTFTLSSVDSKVILKITVDQYGYATMYVDEDTRRTPANELADILINVAQELKNCVKG